MDVRPFRQDDEAQVVELWRACGLTRPWNDPHKDVRRKLAKQPEWFLVGEVDGAVVASVMAGYDGHRGTVFYLAVSPAHRRQGFGRTLMRHVERALLAAGCPKINLLVRSDNSQATGFYQRLGYAIEQVVGLGKRLESDSGS
jgi:ribosomal protein S18 acetylase RimI-like enzyme